jgi:SAM-dependent methyltransferase
MSAGRVDYDRVAPGYDRRHADGGPQGPARALAELARAVGAGPVLEAGCGTGHWLAGLSDVAGGSLYGLDLSAGMLAQAKVRDVALDLVRGRAGRLPFRGDHFDLVSCVNAIHHFAAPSAFVTEAHRVLRGPQQAGQHGGALAVIGMDMRNLRDRWYIYDYFPGTWETDLARFPAWDRVAVWMAGAGFGEIRRHIVEEIVDDKRGRAVLQDPFLRKDAISQLTLLSDEAYAAGVARIEADLAAAEAAGRDLVFPVDIVLAMMVGWKV